MMPERSPIHIPAYLRGEADPAVFDEIDSLAGLVERGRRLGRFWPPAAAEPAGRPGATQAPRRPSFRIGAREARLYGEVPE